MCGQFTMTRSLYNLRLFLSLIFLQLLISCDNVSSFAVNNVDSKSSSSPSNVITKRDACRAEISAICGDRVNVDAISDLEASDCLLNKERNETTLTLTEHCHHALWLFRRGLMTNEGFRNQLGSDCVDEIEHLLCPKQTFLPGSPHTSIPSTFLVECVIDKKDKFQAPMCRQTVSLVERVMFSDYELIERFAGKCQKDIEALNCGRNDLSRQKGQGTQFLPNSQGYTIECLSKEIGSLQEECAVEILRVAELQADDYHLDRALYFACRDDRERFCPSVSSGNGKVYKCLLKNKMEETMSSGCRDQLYRRQKLGWHDYKASGIIFSCKAEIKKNTCRKGASETDKHVRLSQILLCLENAAHTGQDIDPECLEEMKQHRRGLMEDHRVTPELLVNCSDEIATFCKKGKGLNGRTIHCLMDHALMRDKSQRISTGCRARLEDLVKMADVTEDWRVDPVLKENCQPVVAKSSCHDLPANSIMGCLMHLLSDSVSGPDMHAMTEECEIALFQIQYFVTRDFPLDSTLFTACRSDAESICHVSGNWSDTNIVQASPGPLVLSCLYRNIAGEDDENRESDGRKVSPACAARVKETMKQRALSVSLMPEIEEPCLVDLAHKCSVSTKHEEELVCLQNNLEDLEEPCKKAVVTFTKLELKNPTIDPYLSRYCHEAIESKCQSHVNLKAQSSSEDEEDNLLECLVKAKPEIKSKPCRTTLDHYQLIQLKHIEFTPKFKALCNSDVIRHCNQRDGLKTSTKLVSCLSQIIWSDTINDSTPRISKGCRKQVKYLILSKIQIENKIEPGTIYSLCGNYVNSLCREIVPGGGRVFECLRSHREQITELDCYNALFKLEQQVDNDNALDVHLINECEPEIKLFCAGRAYQKEYNPGLQTQNLIQCLKVSREKEGFNNERCGKVLQARLLEQNTDARLNPALRKACSLDIPKFCKRVPAGSAKVIGCLKRAFVQDPAHLTKSCTSFLEEMLQGAAETDIRLDYTLFKSCENEIKQSCTSHGVYEQSGKVEECLTSLFHNQSLTGTCRDQVQLLIQATQVDIHVDPTLNRACAIDLLRICDGVPPGEGRLMACLLNELDLEKAGGEQRLHPNCRKLLSARYELFQLAGSPSKMESLEDLYATVSESQHKNYFLIVGVSVVGFIFIFGLFCGRATRRSKTVSKNK